MREKLRAAESAIYQSKGVSGAIGTINVAALERVCTRALRFVFPAMLSDAQGPIENTKGVVGASDPPRSAHDSSDWTGKDKKGDERHLWASVQQEVFLLEQDATV